MWDFNRIDGLKLCCLSYYDVVSFHKGMSFKELMEGVLKQPLRLDPFYTHLRDFIQNQDYDKFQDFYVSEYVNHNNQSGLVFFTLENEDQMIVVIRGSEYLDELNHDCGWEDWRDNLEIFLGITKQQLEIGRWFHELKTEKAITLCGHSKGGNLALYLGVTCNEEKLNRISSIMTFNAPGMNDDMMKQYQERILDEAFLNKCQIYENEHDCVSSFFNHVKAPMICASCFGNNSMNDCIVNHQLYAYKIEENDLVDTDKKSVLPFVLDSLINKVFAKQNKEFLTRFIEHLMEYIRGDLQKEELYHMVLYQIGKKRDLFHGYDEDEIRTIEIDTLLNGLSENVKRNIESVPSQLGRLFDEVNGFIRMRISQLKGDKNGSEEK